MDTIPQDSTPRKRCTGPCGRTLPATPEYFSRKKNGKHGLKSQCKQCQSEEGKAYRKAHPEVQKQHYEAHREEKLQYAAEYRAVHRETHRQYCVQYNIEHREELREKRSKHYSEHREEHKERNVRNYKAHSQERRRYAAIYRQEHPEQVKIYRDNNRDEHRQYDKKHYQEHREEKSLYNIKYRQDHYEELRESYKIYRQSERGRIAARKNSHNRKSRKRNAEGSHTIEELQQQLLRQKSRCYYCHKKLGKGRDNWHADHVVPLSKGGTNDISNIVIACPTCNMRKHNKMLHEWKDGGRLL